MDEQSTPTDTPSNEPVPTKPMRIEPIRPTESLDSFTKCPHCNEPFIISELNCGIFRHGVFRDTGEQVPPHSSKIECDHFYNSGNVYGCCKPFRVNIIDNKYVVEICEYI